MALPPEKEEQRSSRRNTLTGTEAADMLIDFAELYDATLPHRVHGVAESRAELLLVVTKLLGILTGEIPRQEDLEQVLPFEADVARWCTRETDGLFD